MKDLKDLKDLLARALDDGPPAAHAGAGHVGEAHEGALPVEDDLARGQRLRRRRTHKAAVAASAAVAVVAVAVIVPNVASGWGPAGLKATAASHPAPKLATTRIKLVDYTGAQPPGYTVTVIPYHWVIQGSNPYALTIAPANASSKDPNVFVGKLVILQESFDTTQTQGLTKTDVRGHTAYYGVQDATASLVIEQAPGRWLDVQAPTSLGWTEQQEAQFGAGVTILPTAQEG